MPRTYSIEMYGSPLTSPKSKVRSTFGCVDAASELDLALEAVELLGVEQCAGLEHFQRDDIIEFEVVRLVDDAHAAGTEHRQHAIASAERRTRREIRPCRARGASTLRVRVPKYAA